MYTIFKYRNEIKYVMHLLFKRCKAQNQTSNENIIETSSREVVSKKLKYLNKIQKFEVKNFFNEPKKVLPKTKAQVKKDTNLD